MKILKEEKSGLTVKGQLLTIKNNSLGNWYGYIGGRRTEVFIGEPNEQKSAALDWFNGLNWFNVMEVA